LTRGADLGPHLLDELGGNVAHVPLLRRAAHAHNKVAQKHMTLRRVRNLGMELQPKHAPLQVGNGRVLRVARVGNLDKPRGHRSNLVAVRHPHLSVRHALQQNIGRVRSLFNHSSSKLALC
jgi:hypothetical protein